VIDFDDELRERIAGNLGRHQRLELPLEGRRHAAVAILLVDSSPGSDAIDPFGASAEDLSVIPSDVSGLDGRMADVAGGASFVLCRRSAGLNRHASQWALPGGRLDEGETPVDAALRETDEEVGVRLGADAVLGVLDDYATRSGYVITPVVVWGGTDVEIVPHPGEVLASVRHDSRERPTGRAGAARRRPDPRADRRPARAVPLGRPRRAGGRTSPRLRATGVRVGLIVS
jgi:8-oxo-dGTP pyrophosphatase MutT (NUDIX family)